MLRATSPAGRGARRRARATASLARSRTGGCELGAAGPCCSPRRLAGRALRALARLGADSDAFVEVERDDAVAAAARAARCEGAFEAGNREVDAAEAAAGPNDLEARVETARAADAAASKLRKAAEKRLRAPEFEGAVRELFKPSRPPDGDRATEYAARGAFLLGDEPGLGDGGEGGAQVRRRLRLAGLLAVTDAVPRSRPTFDKAGPRGRRRAAPWQRRRGRRRRPALGAWLRSCAARRRRRTQLRAGARQMPCGGSAPTPTLAEARLAGTAPRAAAGPCHRSSRRDARLADCGVAGLWRGGRRAGPALIEGGARARRRRRRRWTSRRRARRVGRDGAGAGRASRLCSFARTWCKRRSTDGDGSALEAAAKLAAGGTGVGEPRGAAAAGASARTRGGDLALRPPRRAARRATSPSHYSRGAVSSDDTKNGHSPYGGLARRLAAGDETPPSIPAGVRAAAAAARAAAADADVVERARRRAGDDLRAEARAAAASGRARARRPRAGRRHTARPATPSPRTGRRSSRSCGGLPPLRRLDGRRGRARHEAHAAAAGRRPRP